jgi:prepilin-type N-terminal cleavage/methylation domain-containing protein
MSDVLERLRFRGLRFEEAAEAGFTLVELIVVVLVIGVLLAIVVPSFLSPPKTAISTAAPANLLYTNDNQSQFGVCGSTAVSTTTSTDKGLTLVSGRRSTKASTVSINPSGAHGQPVPAISSLGATDCRITIYQKAMQPTRANSAGTTNLATGTYY